MQNIFDPLSKPINSSLTEKKIDHIQKSKFLSRGTINFYFHGIHIEINSSSQIFLEQTRNYLPKAWLTNEKGSFVISHIPIPQSISEEFDNEPSSITNTIFQNGFEFGIQRDFVAMLDSQSSCKAIFSENIDDGFHNFFRWFLSPRILKYNKIMIHSSVVINKNGKAFVFLGPSGAGKTTITELSSPRDILSDDMNLLYIEQDKVFVQSGGVGGLYKPTVALDRAFQVENIFWLNQSPISKITEASLIDQYKWLISSFANLPWSSFKNKENQEIIQLAKGILTLKEIKLLSFEKNSKFWRTIEKQD